VAQPLNLLGAAYDIHKVGITRFGNNSMIYELMGRANDGDEVFRYLQRYWNAKGEEVVYLIDLEGLYVLGPSASSAFVEGVTLFSKQREKPVVLLNVHPEALKGLRTCEYTSKNNPTVWAFDTEHHLNFIGDPPERWKRVLHELQKRGQASASDLAEDNTKASINKFSVYLQELFNARLVTREKVGGSDRPGGGERGWTYTYRPAYQNVDEGSRELV